MTPSSGTIGTEATLTIGSSAIPLHGDYRVLWSPLATFDEDKTTVLAEGNIPNGVEIITTRFTVPESRYGINYVQFMRVGHDELVNMQFSVRPSIQINPNVALPGTTITVIGKGFPANSTGKIICDEDPTNAKPFTNSTGSFTTSFAAPEFSPGSYLLTVDVEGLYPPVIGTLTVLPIDDPDPEPEPQPEPDNPTPEPPQDIQPPPPPVTIAPMGHSFGLFGSRLVTFRWNDVSDPSGITYTLEVSDSVSFNNIGPGMRKGGLTQPMYVINVEPGTYYWRVKAIDGIGNESYWSYASYAFKVGEISSLFNNIANFFKSLFGY